MDVVTRLREALAKAPAVPLEYEGRVVYGLGASPPDKRGKTYPVNLFTATVGRGLDASTTKEQLDSLPPLIVAAVNALPALLDVVEAGRAIVAANRSGRHVGEVYGEVGRLAATLDALAEAKIP